MTAASLAEQRRAADVGLDLGVQRRPAETHRPFVMSQRSPVPHSQVCDETLSQPIGRDFVCVLFIGVK